ncbi:M14 family zinc carboxypeptidase [Mycolicibacterium elephantis]|uniref:M14 family zinc carboxypeptidase n=1 Tax=Mycolicibacterium elephantis TaxID=81858 RepID=UPI003A86EE97
MLIRERQTHIASKALIAIAVLVSAAGCGSSSSDKANALPTTSVSAQPSDEATSSSPAATVKPGPREVVEPWETVGTSVQGKPIRLRSVGYGPRKVLVIGGIHGDEPEGEVVVAELPAAFNEAEFAEKVTLTILEDANPDGRAAGTRGNANGVDINRNFPASNFDRADPSNGGEPLSEPEARAVINTIDRVQPNLVLVVHSWAGRQFINFDGPSREIAERFSTSSGLPVEESSSFAPTPGSLGSYFGRDRGIPVLTIEVLKGADPTAVWHQLRPAFLQVIGG